MKIKSIEFEGYEDVYNMEVNDHHNFAVNGGIIVHNCDAFRYYCAGRPSPYKAPVQKTPSNFWSMQQNDEEGLW